MNLVASTDRSRRVSGTVTLQPEHRHAGERQRDELVNADHQHRDDGAGRHRLVVRATGVNGDTTPRKVTHLLQLWVDVATGGGGNEDYIDIVGFAVMRIAAMDSNTVSAYAITPVIADMNDPQLRRGQVARLVPWN